MLGSNRVVGLLLTTVVAVSQLPTCVLSWSSDSSSAQEYSQGYSPGSTGPYNPYSRLAGRREQGDDYYPGRREDQNRGGNRGRPFFPPWNTFYRRPQVVLPKSTKYDGRTKYGPFPGGDPYWVPSPLPQPPTDPFPYPFPMPSPPVGPYPNPPSGPYPPVGPVPYPPVGPEPYPPVGPKPYPPVGPEPYPPVEPNYPFPPFPPKPYPPGGPSPYPPVNPTPYPPVQPKPYPPVQPKPYPPVQPKPYPPVQPKPYPPVQPKPYPPVQPKPYPPVQPKPYPPTEPNPYPTPYPDGGSKPYPKPYPDGGSKPYPKPNPDGGSKPYPRPYPDGGSKPYPKPYPDGGSKPYPKPYPDGGSRPYPPVQPKPYPPGPGPYPQPTRPVRPSLPSSLCDNCRFKNGVGYNPFPNSCQDYVTCQPTKGYKLLPTKMSCPYNLFWSQRLLTCVRPKETKCQFDPCSKGSQTAPVYGNCAAYHICNGYKYTNAIYCCAYGHRYQNGYGYNKPGAQPCVRDPTCLDTCAPKQTPIRKERCRLFPVDNNPYKYQELVHGKYIYRSCAPGTAFVLKDCGCTTRVKIAPKPGCYPEIHIDFKYGIRDVSGKFVSIGNEWNKVKSVKTSVAKDGYAGEFAKGQLILWRFSNAPLGPSLKIAFSFLEKPFKTGGYGGKNEILVSNGDCGKGPSVSITFDRATRTVTALVHTASSYKNYKPATVTVPYAPGEYKQVIYMYDGKYLTLTVNSQSSQQTKSVAVYGKVLVSQCSLSIGGVKGATPFYGLLDEFKLFLCAPKPVVPKPGPYPGPYPAPNKPGSYPPRRNPYPNPSGPGPYPVPGVPYPDPSGKGPYPPTGNPYPVPSGPGPYPVPGVHYPGPSGKGPNPPTGNPYPVPSGPGPYPAPGGPYPDPSGKGPYPPTGNPYPVPIGPEPYPAPGASYPSGKGPYPPPGNPYPLPSGPLPYPLPNKPGKNPFPGSQKPYDPKGPIYSENKNSNPSVPYKGNQW